MRQALAIGLVMLAGCGDAGADDEATTYAAAVQEVGITEGACGLPVSMGEIPPLYTVESCVGDACLPVDYVTAYEAATITSACHSTNEATVTRVRWVR